jgi:DNA-binding Lrp family transcriptional regulator
MKVVVQTSESAIKTFRLLSNLTIKNIINYLRDNGPSPPSRIARGTGISPSTASRCLQEMKDLNIVKAKWETASVDDRPLKIYSLVPNILRFEFVLNDPNTQVKPSHKVNFMGDSVSDFKEDDRKGIYTSLGDVPFKFDSHSAEILKEISRGDYSYEDLKDKFKENKEFGNVLKHMMTLGLVEVTKG